MCNRYLFALSGFMFVILSISGCSPRINQQALKKIDFDPQAVDDKGLLHGTKVDYEFCIPRNEGYLAEIKSIVPEVLISETSQGRIRCGRDEYLCIVSAGDSNWKEKLYAVASLPYVERIIRTYYE